VLAGDLVTANAGRAARIRKVRAVVVLGEGSTAVDVHVRGRIGAFLGDGLKPPGLESSGPALPRRPDVPTDLVEVADRVGPRQRPKRGRLCVVGLLEAREH